MLTYIIIKITIFSLFYCYIAVQSSCTDIIIIGLQHHTIRREAICSKTHACTVLGTANRINGAILFYVIYAYFICIINLSCGEGNFYVTFRLNFFSIVFKSNIQSKYI